MEIGERSEAPTVLIVPFMELKRSSRVQQQQHPVSLNRTFYGIETSMSCGFSNRELSVLIVPFMELKHYYDVVKSVHEQVLIVPFMELKPKNYVIDDKGNKS